MNWWLGFCLFLGICSALTLDYRGRQRGGKPWLAAGWPLRILFVTSAGVLVALIIGLMPVMLYRVSLSFVALYQSPPTQAGMLALLPGAAGWIFGVWVMGPAHRQLLKSRDQRRGGLAGHGVLPFVLAVLLWLLGTFSIGGGVFATLVLARDL